MPNFDNLAAAALTPGGVMTGVNSLVSSVLNANNQRDAQRQQMAAQQLQNAQFQQTQKRLILEAQLQAALKGSTASNKLDPGYHRAKSLAISATPKSRTVKNTDPVSLATGGPPTYDEKFSTEELSKMIEAEYANNLKNWGLPPLALTAVDADATPQGLSPDVQSIMQQLSAIAGTGGGVQDMLPSQQKAPLAPPAQQPQQAPGMAPGIPAPAAPSQPQQAQGQGVYTPPLTLSNAPSTQTQQPQRRPTATVSGAPMQPQGSQQREGLPGLMLDLSDTSNRWANATKAGLSNAWQGTKNAVVGANDWLYDRISAEALTNKVLGPPDGAGSKPLNVQTSGVDQSLLPPAISGLRPEQARDLQLSRINPRLPQAFAVMDPRDQADFMSVMTTGAPEAKAMAVQRALGLLQSAPVAQGQ